MINDSIIMENTKTLELVVDYLDLVCVSHIFNINFNMRVHSKAVLRFHSAIIVIIISF